MLLQFAHTNVHVYTLSENVDTLHPEGGSAIGSLGEI
jgi:hypothetical protein